MESNEYLYKADLRKSLTQLVFEADLAKKQTEELIKNGQAITQPELDETNARISEIIAHNGDGTKDTEVIDARKGQTTLRDKINLIDSDIEKMTKDYGDTIVSTLGSNLLNADNITFNYWVNPTNGLIYTTEYTSSYCISDKIKVKEMTKYSYRHPYGIFSFVTYDKSGNIVRYGRHHEAFKDYVLTTTINEASIVLCYKDFNSIVDELVFFQSDKPTHIYIPMMYELINSPYVKKGEIVQKNKVALSVPEQYDLVVNDNFELFYKGIVLSNNPYKYNIKIECEKGQTYSKRFIYKPTKADVGTHVFKISIIDDNENVLDNKLINLVVKNKATSPTSVQNILEVGDSLANPIRMNEVSRRLKGSGGTPAGDGLTNLNFIGTCGTDVKYEGYGGWTFDDYNGAGRGKGNIAWIDVTSGMKTEADQHSIYKDANNSEWKLETIDVENNKIKIIRTSGATTLPASGTLTWVSGGNDNTDIVYTFDRLEGQNPFWFNDKVDFKAYATDRGVSTIDYINVLLGWNNFNATEVEYKNKVRTFINNVKISFPDCKITLVGLQVGSLDGMGYNYGTSWNFYDTLKHVFNLNKWYEDLTKEYTNVYFVQSSGQFDSENNMPMRTRPVNNRNAKTEEYGVNGVHPHESGYLQIADADYRHMIHLLQP